MSLKNKLADTAMKDPEQMKLNEEWNNFMKRVGEVSTIVKDMASGDSKKANAAKTLADQYLTGKVILDDNIQMKVKDDRTVINQKAFRTLEKNDAVSYSQKT